MMQTNPLSWKLRVRHVMLYSYYVSREQNNMKFLEHQEAARARIVSQGGLERTEWRPIQGEEQACRYARQKFKGRLQNQALRDKARKTGSTSQSSP